jgi:hypothetical protein
MIASAEQEGALMQRLWSLKNDPLAFVMFAYPWGVAGTPLATIKGPRKWQRDVLDGIKAHLEAGHIDILNKLQPAMLRDATASGRGIGKSALVGWLTHWQMSVAPGSTTIVTANTEGQLASKTWPEIKKWFGMAMNAHWFDLSATKVAPAKWFAELLTKKWKMDVGYYYAQAQTWSEENADAFAGAHNHNGMMVIFDEASGIPANIWTVTEGFFTEATLRRFWFVFSNPRRNSGAFFECFHKYRNQWTTRSIDARTIEENDPKVYQGIIDAHGIDSDQARIEVLGQFPNQGERQFISNSLVTEAVQRELTPDEGAPLAMSVDVARSGDNKSVIAFRAGRDARSIPWQKHKERDSTRLAELIATAAQTHNVDAIFIDGNGVGGPIADILKRWGYNVIEVQASATPRDEDTFANKRAEMWHDMRSWLAGGSIPDDQELFDDLTKIEYDYHVTNGKLKMESKDDMLRRGLASPDVGDALMMTFAAPVARKNVAHSRAFRHSRMATGMDEDLMG